MIVKGAKTFNRKIANILIIQLGDIGDVVWSTPTFKAVKDAYPQAKISVLLRDGFGSLLEANRLIDGLFEVKRYRGNIFQRARKQVTFIRGIRRERFDVVFDLRLDDRGAYLTFFSGAPIRISARHPTMVWRNRLFTHLVDPTVPEEKEHGAAEQSLRLVKAFGIVSSDTKPRLWIKDGTIARVRRILDREGISEIERWISLNPFSRWSYKEWGYDNWGKIVDWIWVKYKIPTVIVGSSVEREKADHIKRMCSGRVFNLTGKTTLDELVGLLSLSYFHMGVDSAAPHIAAAVGTPTITIYGPTNWREWSPQGDIHSVITPSDYSCAPCYQKGCDGKGRSRCLEELKVEKVSKAIENFIDDTTKHLKQLEKRESSV
ncbi:MAG: glycosyltransferase family 9 protein [Deltaproteobacteria bacterium]|nr:glycosyltransferase family 9 protein [Deltaproteobacteria bacterium]